MVVHHILDIIGSEAPQVKPEGQRVVAMELRDKEDFECTLCYR